MLDSLVVGEMIRSNSRSTHATAISRPPTILKVMTQFWAEFSNERWYAALVASTVSRCVVAVVEPLEVDRSDPGSPRSKVAAEGAIDRSLRKAWRLGNTQDSGQGSAVPRSSENAILTRSVVGALGALQDGCGQPRSQISPG